MQPNQKHQNSNYTESSLYPFAANNGRKTNGSFSKKASFHPLPTDNNITKTKKEKNKKISSAIVNYEIKKQQLTDDELTDENGHGNTL